MGQALSELNSTAKRNKENQKDNFYEELRKSVQNLTSFKKIEHYSTTDYRTQYAVITLNETDPNVKDDQLEIEHFLNENKRDNWNVSIRMIN